MKIDNVVNSYHNRSIRDMWQQVDGCLISYTAYVIGINITYCSYTFSKFENWYGDYIESSFLTQEIARSNRAILFVYFNYFCY